MDCIKVSSLVIIALLFTGYALQFRAVRPFGSRGASIDDGDGSETENTVERRGVGGILLYFTSAGSMATAFLY